MFSCIYKLLRKRGYDKKYKGPKETSEYKNPESKFTKF